MYLDNNRQGNVIGVSAGEVLGVRPVFARDIRVVVCLMGTNSASLADQTRTSTVWIPRARGQLYDTHPHPSLP